MDSVQNAIMVELGLDKLPPEEQAAMFQRIGAVLFQGIVLRALESLSEEEQDKVDAFIGEHPDDPDALINYLRENVPDFDALASDEVARFKANAQELRQQNLA